MTALWRHVFVPCYSFNLGHLCLSCLLITAFLASLSCFEILYFLILKSNAAKYSPRHPWATFDVRVP